MTFFALRLARHSIARLATTRHSSSRGSDRRSNVFRQRTGSHSSHVKTDVHRGGGAEQFSFRDGSHDVLRSARVEHQKDRLAAGSHLLDRRGQRTLVFVLLDILPFALRWIGHRAPRLSIVGLSPDVARHPVCRPSRIPGLVSSSGSWVGQQCDRL